MATGKKIGQLVGHNAWVGSLVFWPDGTRLASASADQTIRVWDVANRKCPDVMHANREELWRMDLLPDQKTLVSGAEDGTVCFWDTSAPPSSLQEWGLTTGRETQSWPGVVPAAYQGASALSPDQQLCMVIDIEGDVVG